MDEEEFYWKVWQVVMLVLMAVLVVWLAKMLLEGS